MNLDSTIAKIHQLFNSSDEKNHSIACQLLRGNKDFAEAFANEESIHKLIISLQTEQSELVLLFMKRDKELGEKIEARYWPLVEFAGGKSMTALRTIGNRIRRIEKKWKLDFALANWKVYTPFDEYVSKLPIKKIDLFLKPTKRLPFFISKLPQLESISINKCQLKEVPDYWENLTNLKHLRLSNNLLTSLPQSIALLKNLQTLGLNGNRYTEVPAVISGLTQVSSLSIGRGKAIHSLPEWIGNFTNLTYLSFAQSQISRLPDSFGNLTNLQKLFIFRTPLAEKYDFKVDNGAKPEKVQAYIKTVLNNQNKES